MWGWRVCHSNDCAEVEIGSDGEETANTDTKEDKLKEGLFISERASEAHGIVRVDIGTGDVERSGDEELLPRVKSKRVSQGRSCTCCSDGNSSNSSSMGLIKTTRGAEAECNRPG